MITTILGIPVTTLAILALVLMAYAMIAAMVAMITDSDMWNQITLACITLGAIAFGVEICLQAIHYGYWRPS